MLTSQGLCRRRPRGRTSESVLFPAANPPRQIPPSWAAGEKRPPPPVGLPKTGSSHSLDGRPGSPSEQTDLPPSILRRRRVALSASRLQGR
eukprot:scaffold1857_cov247-Pinguiococcus_pyrenoidosus.AAC.6